MTTKPRRKTKPAAIVFLDYPSWRLYQPAHDLFGEIPVTETDLYDWVANVAPLYLSKRAFANYVRGYDVANKVRLAKERGTWDGIKANPSRPWHARLALNAII